MAAIFLLTALAVLGAVLVRMTMLQSEETLNEWYSAQALYAAESGVQWSARNLLEGGSGETSIAVVTDGAAWFTTSVSSVVVNGRSLHSITSTGTAGGTAGSPRAQRQLAVQFMD